jgi:hypothetical protein
MLDDNYAEKQLARQFLSHLPEKNQQDHRTKGASRPASSTVKQRGGIGNGNSASAGSIPMEELEAKARRNVADLKKIARLEKWAKGLQFRLSLKSRTNNHNFLKIF